MSPLTIFEPNLEHALAVCRERIGRRKSHLVAVSEQLESPLRRNMFAVCYAAMRVLDDVVDEDYVVEADRSREATEAYIDRWRQQAEEAANGTFQIGEDVIECDIFFALNAYAGASEIGATPWHHLGAAMRTDVARSGIEDWGSFETYCRGASIAPAEVFLYILSCRLDGERASASSLPRPTVYYAKDLALFCYLVHILRDLAKDARRDKNLIVVPRSVLDDVGLDDGGLIAAIEARDSAALQPLADILIERASVHRRRGETRMREISGELSPNSNAALAGLIRRYVETFDVMSADYDGHLRTTNWGLGVDSASPD
jgi:phytoene/squalene synthetase